MSAITTCKDDCGCCELRSPITRLGVWKMGNLSFKDEEISISEIDAHSSREEVAMAPKNDETSNNWVRVSCVTRLI